MSADKPLFVIEPQRDEYAGTTLMHEPEGTTWFVKCAEADAEVFALLGWSAAAGEYELIDDYPSRAAAFDALVAEARAVAAIEAKLQEKA